MSEVFSKTPYCLAVKFENPCSRSCSSIFCFLL